MTKAQRIPGLTLPLDLAEARATIPIKDATGKTIASVKYGPHDLYHARFIQSACNSHTELLEACKMALQHFGTQQHMHKVLTAAIAKATA